MKHITPLLLCAVPILFFSSCSKNSSGDSNGQATGASGSTARFTISGNYLYTVDQFSIKTFLISNPNQPVFKSKTDIGINIETIFPYKDKLFIGSTTTMYIFSLTDPAHPQQTGSATYEIHMSCDPVVVQDNVAFAALRAEGPCGWGRSALVVYDISSPSSPQLKTTVPLNSPYGLGIKDSALYVCSSTNGLSIFNVANPFDPIPVASITDKTFYDVIPYDNVLICQVSDGFALYDISADPLKPVYISNILN